MFAQEIHESLVVEYLAGSKSRRPLHERLQLLYTWNIIQVDECWWDSDLCKSLQPHHPFKDHPLEDLSLEKIIKYVRSKHT